MLNGLILFEENETKFDTYGICVLTGAISCKVTEEINGVFELEMEYPIDDKYYKELKFRRIIYCKPGPNRLEQAFRIDDITTPINRVVTISASHISYDLSGYVVEPFKTTNAGYAMTALNSNKTDDCPFTFSNDLTKDGEVDFVVPRTIRSLLGNDFVDIYKGEYIFDNFKVHQTEKRGKDRDVVVRYGKNLIDMNQEENISKVYTKVYPYWYSSNKKPDSEEEEGLVTISGKTIKVGEYNFNRTYMYDLSSEFKERPTEEQMIQKTNEHIKDEKIGEPEISISLSYFQLSRLEEYQHIKFNDTIELGDEVTVVFEDAKVNTKARCNKTVYDPLLNEYTTIELGDAKRTLADGIADTNSSNDDRFNQNDKNINDKIDHNNRYFQDMLDKLTDDITGNSGGYIRLSPSVNPTDLLIMDTPNIETATIVWRWNKSGLGVSTSGFQGPYKGIAQDGRLVIDEVTTQLVKGNNLEMNLSDGWTKWYHHKDGYTLMDGSGMSRNGRPYHNAMAVGTGLTGGSDGIYPKTIRVQLPEEFKGKRFSVVCSMVDTQGGIVEEYMKRVNLTWGNYDYVNATFDVAGYWTAIFKTFENEKELQWSYIAIGG